MALAVGTAGALAHGADDDWEVVDHTFSVHPPATESSPAATVLPDGAFLACGERALPAKEPFKSIIATLNEMWGTRAPIYESVARISPHVARSGGCIFYNLPYIHKMTIGRMRVTDEDQFRMMLYEICAHELGHLVHGDPTPARAGVPPVIRELEADRFAGYTLHRLNPGRFDAAQIDFYEQAIGDDFEGVQNGHHGSGQQRAAAFQQGWDLARTGVAEDAVPLTLSGLE